MIVRVSALLVAVFLIIGTWSNTIDQQVQGLLDTAAGHLGDAVGHLGDAAKDLATQLKPETPTVDTSAARQLASAAVLGGDISPATLKVTVSPCYKNYTQTQNNHEMQFRLPSSLQNFIGLVRVVEQNQATRNWDFTDIPVLLFDYLRIDGIVNDYGVSTGYSWTNLDFDMGEYIKEYYITTSTRSFPNSVFTWHQQCSMHFMQSHSLNKYVTSEGESCQPTETKAAGVGASTFRFRKQRSIHGEKSRKRRYAYQVDLPFISLCPTENGVISTPYGTVGIGDVIAGISAGIRPQKVKVALTGPTAASLGTYATATVDNLYAATISSEIAEYALGDYQAPILTPVGPGGWWNTTNYNWNYRLETKNVSYMSDAEIRGAIDGFILGNNIKTWKDNIRLSQVLELYYSELGIGADNPLRACDRYTNFDSVINSTLQTESENFAAGLRGVSNYAATVNNAEIPAAITKTISALKDRINLLRSDTTTDPPCKRSISNLVTTPVYSPENVDLYIVLDFTITDQTDFQHQKTLVASLAQLLDMSSWSSRINLISNTNGSILLSQNDSHNAGEIANFVYNMTYSPPTGSGTLSTFNLGLVMNVIEVMLLEEERTFNRLGISGSNSKFLFFISLGSQIVSSGADQIRQQFYSLNNSYPDLQSIFYTIPSYQSTYDDFVPAKNVILKSTDGPTAALNLVDNVFVKTPFRLFYQYCHQNSTPKLAESRYTYTGYATPGAIRIYYYHPSYFFSSTNLQITFTADKSSSVLTLCSSRTLANLESSNIKLRNCTTSIANTAVSNEISLGKPCTSTNQWQGCNGLYFSVKAAYSGLDMAQCDSSTYNLAGTYPVCRFPDQVKFTITHSGMECNSGIAKVASLWAMILSALVLYFSRQQ